MTRKEQDGDEDATTELDIGEDDAFIQHLLKDKCHKPAPFSVAWSIRPNPLLLSPYPPGALDLWRKLYCTVRGTV
jgi:hypothetical protein